MKGSLGWIVRRDQSQMFLSRGRFARNTKPPGNSRTRLLINAAGRISFILNGGLTRLNDPAMMCPVL
jgi:hypothetical protein